MLKNKFFSDYFKKKNDYTLARYNNIEKTKIIVRVHTGILEIKAIYKSKSKVAKFTEKPDSQQMTFDPL